MSDDLSAVTVGNHSCPTVAGPFPNWKRCVRAALAEPPVPPEDVWKVCDAELVSRLVKALGKETTLHHRWTESGFTGLVINPVSGGFGLLMGMNLNPPTDAQIAEIKTRIEAG